MSESFSDRPAWVAKPCCEEAALNAAEINRLRGELYKAQTRLEDAENRADELQSKLDDLTMTVTELAPAEQRPTLDREAVEQILDLNSNMNAYQTECVVDAILSLAPAVPSWLGDIPEKPEVKKVLRSIWEVNGLQYSGLWSPEEFRRDAYHRLALADAIEAEEAQRNDDEQRIEKRATRLYLSTQGEISVAWESLTEPMRNGFRAAIDAGWTPPESEDKK